MSTQVTYAPAEPESEVIRSFQIPTKAVDQDRKDIADQIVTAFKWSLLTVLLAGPALMITALAVRLSPGDVTQLTKEAVVPYLTTASTFASTVFGPLLAFILGHYFGQRGAADSKAADGQK